MRTLPPLLLLMAALAGAPQAAALPQAAAPAVRYDTAAVTVRRPEAERLEAYRRDPAYAYDREPDAPESLWARIGRWINAQLARLFSPALSPVRRWLAYLAVALGVGFAVTRLLRMELTGVVSRRGARAAATALPDEEALPAPDLQARLDAAVAALDYRRAVRLTYLLALRRLADARRVAWRLDKTNHEYLDELADPALREAFARLTYVFDYAWYGHFPVSAAAYERARRAAAALDLALTPA